MHIISHTDLDGVTAAALAWRTAQTGKGVVRVSLVGYGEVDNLILESRSRGDRIIVTDLSPQNQATVDIIDRSFTENEKPFLFDHHKSTIEKYGNRPWAVTDIDSCGAKVYWDWLHDGNADEETLAAVESMRGIVEAANDRDLWINALPDGRLWQAMVTLCGEWGIFARLITNPSGSLSDSERIAAADFVDRQEKRFRLAAEKLIRVDYKSDDGGGRLAFLGDGELEFGDSSDFCGMVLDRADENPENTGITLVALAYRRPNGTWAVSLRSRSGIAGRIVGLLKDGRKIRGGGHGDAAALYFPNSYDEKGIRESITAAAAAHVESGASMGVTLGDLFKGDLG